MKAPAYTGAEVELKIEWEPKIEPVAFRELKGESEIIETSDYDNGTGSGNENSGYDYSRSRWFR